MLVALANTHGTESPRLTDSTPRAVEAAEMLVHAMDLTTPAGLETLASTGEPGGCPRQQ